jgi:hypothetical protein
MFLRLRCRFCVFAIGDGVEFVCCGMDFRPVGVQFLFQMVRNSLKRLFLAWQGMKSSRTGGESMLLLGPKP